MSTMVEDIKETAIIGAMVLGLMAAIVVVVMWATTVTTIRHSVPVGPSVCAVEPMVGHPGSYSIQRYTDEQGVKGPIVPCP
jgi:hypothetical protein